MPLATSRLHPPSGPARNRTDQVIDALAIEILTGRMTPGTALREATLAATFKVSRNTLREAIRVMVARGLVKQARHRSAVVASIDRDGVIDLYRMRRLLELSAIDANRRQPPETLHEVGAAVERLAKASGRGSDTTLIEADLAFHRAIVRLHGSQRIEQSFAGCLDELRLALAVLSSADQILGRLLDEHRMMYAHLLRGEHDRCRDKLGKHLADSERSVLAALTRS